MPTTIAGWELEVERGPGWLFVKPHWSEPDESPEVHSLADQIWSLLEQHFVYRVVLDLDEMGNLDPPALAQLVKLYRRCHDHGGCMRLCGLNPYNRRLLRLRGLSGLFPAHESPEEAVMGFSRRKPR